MLIVVAIIAILIAVSIPLINNALEKAKHATDAANERAAKAEILLQYMADGGTAVKAGEVYYYDAATGSIKEKTVTTVAGYGKHTNSHKNKIIAIRIKSTTDPTVEMMWTTEKVSFSGAFTDDTNLCSLKEVAATDHS